VSDEAHARPDQEELDPDAAIIVANLRSDLRAREAEIEALRSQVKRPGYDPVRGAVVGERRGGRPRVVTPQIQAVLLRSLRSGMTRAVACARARISTTSLTNAMRSDPLFKEDVARAEVACIAAAEKAFARHAAKGDDYKAAESYLKRRNPDVWALPSERVLAPNVAENKAVKEEVLAGLVAALIGPTCPGEATSARAQADEDELADHEESGE